MAYSVDTIFGSEKYRSLNEDESLLIEYYKNPSNRLEEEIVMRNSALVKHFIHKLNISALEPEEQFSIGVEALILAIRKFNPEKGYKFSTYAGRSIIRAILKEWSRNRLGYGVKCSTDTEVFERRNAVVSVSSYDENPLDTNNIGSCDDYSDVEVLQLLQQLRLLEENEIVKAVLADKSLEDLADELDISKQSIKDFQKSLVSNFALREFVEA